MSILINLETVDYQYANLTNWLLLLFSNFKIIIKITKKLLIFLKNKKIHKQ